MTRPHTPQDPADPFLTTRQAAQLLGVTLRSVQLWVEAGKLPAGHTPGGHRRIRQSAVEALAAQQRIDIAPTPQQVAAQRDVEELRAQLERALADGKRLHEAYSAAERELQAARAERDGLMDQVRDEIDANHELRALGGATGDEDMGTFLRRVISERDRLHAEVTRLTALVDRYNLVEAA